MLTITYKRRPALKLSFKQQEKWFGVLVVLPAVLAISAVVVYPLAAGILNSLRDAHMMRLHGAPWIGFDNYIKLFRYPLLWVAVRNSVVYASSVTLAAATIGLLLALQTNTCKPDSKRVVLRTVDHAWSRRRLHLLLYFQFA